MRPAELWAHQLSGWMQGAPPGQPVPAEYVAALVAAVIDERRPAPPRFSVRLLWRRWRYRAEPFRCRRCTAREDERCAAWCPCRGAECRR